MTHLTVTEAIAKLTARGRDLMTQVGQAKFTYFDDGIVGGSGIWGFSLADEMGVSRGSASGILGATKKLGLWNASEDPEAGDDGLWWSLTDLGAEVALTLAGKSTCTCAAQYLDHSTHEQGCPLDDRAERGRAKLDGPEVTVKVGKKWTYIYRGTELLAEVRSDSAAAVIAALQG